MEQWQRCQQALTQLGVSIYNSNGELKSLIEILLEIRACMDKERIEAHEI